MNFISNLFKSNKPEEEKKSFYSTLYPSSVRYALGHNEARLGPSEFHALVHNFPYEVVYLLVKAVAYDVETQRKFIEDLTKLYVQDDYEDDLRDFLKAEIDKLPEGTTVKGTKLAQLSRYGSEYWQKAFHQLVEKMVEDDELAVPRIVAHTPFIAYHHFVKYYKDYGRGQMSVIVPQWMLDKNNSLMGYRVVLPDPVEVELQEKSVCLHGHWDCLGRDCKLNQLYCRRSFFVDDTINTGTTKTKVENFWYSEYGVSVPDEKIRVITDLRHYHEHDRVESE